jgi:hypothetical protein
MSLLLFDFVFSLLDTLYSTTTHSIIMSFLKSFIGGSTAAPATPAVAETKEASAPAADASSSPLTTCLPVDVKKHEYTEEQDKMVS